MRSRDRVLQILPTVNVRVIGDNLYYWPVKDIIDGVVLHLAGYCRPSEGFLLTVRQLLNNERAVASPHVRELLTEALHYLKEMKSE